MSEGEEEKLIKKLNKLNTLLKDLKEKDPE